MALLGAISGRRIGTSCEADWYLSENTWVWIRSPVTRAMPRAPIVGLGYSLASISGTILTMPRSSIAAKPCRRNEERNTSYTSALGNGSAETMLIVPLTRGSITKFLPVTSLTTFTTPSISALTKLSITASGFSCEFTGHAGDMATAIADQSSAVLNDTKYSL